MLSETSIAVSYIVGPLYTNLPRRRVDDFASELDKLLKIKIAPFWIPSQPFSGIHQRCLRVNGPYADPIIFHAASKTGTNPDEIFNLFPQQELKMWIDPSEVSYQLGDQNSEIKYLLRRSVPMNERVFSPSMFAEHNGSNLPYIAKPHAPLFTVSSFSKTKFGSTKLKSNSTPENECVRPDSLNSFEPLNSGYLISPEGCSSDVVSPNNPWPLKSQEANAINISCCLPWSVDINNNSYSNMLTINIPHYNYTNGRESSSSGSLASELNSPVHSY